MEERLNRDRVYLVFVGISVALLLLFFRLGYLQFLHPRNLADRARQQSQIVIEIPPLRGKILDREGRALALDAQMYSLGANPKKIKNIEAVVSGLSRILGISPQFIRDRLSRPREFVWIKRLLSPEMKARIEAAKWSGLEFREEWKRVYPNRSDASHVVGFTGIDHDGLEGVEFFYDSYLKGIPGWKSTLRDAWQREVVARRKDFVLPVDGYDIVLSLHSVIQHIVERELEATCRKYNALGGMVVVLEPDTGDVLALANYPGFDLNHPQGADANHRRNRALTDIYEPGSVFKIVAISAVIEEKLLSMSDTLFCENGEFRIGGRILHDVHPYGSLSLEQVLVKSSNIGTVKAAAKLGPKLFHQYMRKFGFGEKSGIHLPGEISGMVKPPAQWSGTSMSSMPIGQEVGVTAIQMARAIGVILNGGTLVEPRILKEVRSATGKVIREFPPKVKRRVISESTAHQVRDAMVKVVTEGTGKLAKVPGATAGGKTGTAQKLEPNGSYSHSHFIASFAGFIEFEGKKAVILVVIDDPHPVYYGGVVAAPLFSRIGQNLADYWKIESYAPLKE